jgi:hypothetical protein
MSFSTAVGLNQSYALFVRLDIDDKGFVQHVLHQNLELEFPIVSHHPVRRELIFKHPSNRRLYTLKYHH